MANVLVFEPSSRTYLDRLRKLGHRITLLTDSVDSCLAVVSIDQLKLVDDVILVNPYSRSNLFRQVTEANRQLPFDLILSHSEERLIDTAFLCALLHKPFIKPDVAILLRNKYLTRRRLEEMGIEQPRFMLASTEDELMLAVGNIGYPLVVKPTNGRSSLNVVIVQSDEDLPLARKQFRAPVEDLFGISSVPTMLVEEFIAGPLISAEAMTASGKHRLLGVSQRIVSDPPLGQELGGWFPSRAFPIATIEAYLLRILDAIGYDHGPSHVEMIMGKDGPRLVEINPRLPGGVIPQVIGHALDLDIYHLWSQVVSDVMPEAISHLPEAIPRRVAAIRWQVTRESGRLSSIQWPEPVPETIVQYDVVARIGDLIPRPDLLPHRIAYAMSVAATAEEAIASATRFVSGLSLEIVGV